MVCRRLVIGISDPLDPRRLEIATTQTMSASADEEGIRRSEIIGWNLQPASAGFVCVAAVSTAGWNRWVLR